MFQFLGRNSGRSDYTITYPFTFNVVVSIPRSEFWSFGPGSGSVSGFGSGSFQFLGRNSGRSDVIFELPDAEKRDVSIPRSEFWSFGPGVGDQSDSCTDSFNSSVGILVVRTLSLTVDRQSNQRFNSSVGILVVRTCRASC